MGSHDLFLKYPSLKMILQKMCEYVNVDIGDVDFDEKDWFLKHSWTQEQAEDFLNWLANEIRTNKQVREEIWDIFWKPSKSKAKKMASMFVFNYGWKLKNSSES